MPVISLRPIEDIPQGTELDADDYLGSNWTTAFTFSAGRWYRLLRGQTPDDDPATLDDAVQIGQGYWVWFTQDDVIVP